MWVWVCVWDGKSSIFFLWLANFKVSSVIFIWISRFLQFLITLKRFLYISCIQIFRHLFWSMNLFRKIVACRFVRAYLTCMLYVLVNFIPFHSSGQEALGIVNSNYTGVNSLWINPANAAHSRIAVSLNLLAGDGFFNSNYFFIHKKDYGFLKIFKVNST